MVKLLIQDNNIKSHDPYELVRAFYGDVEFDVISDRSILKDISGEDVIELSIYNAIYKVSLSRSGYSIDQEEVGFEDVDFHGNTKSIESNIFKYLIYKVLDRNLDKQLPWGILTGIRPVKVAKTLRDKGLTDNEAMDILEKSYLLRYDKAKLVTDVSASQSGILDSIAKNSYSIYIGIPFCPTRCFYCSFPSLAADRYENVMEEYVNSLIEELDDTLDMMKDWKINTLYIGGGTPTTLPIELMGKLFGFIEENFRGIRELSVEAGRPDTITREYLELMKSHGVDRISINPQTMCDSTLELIGRRHTAEDIVKTYEISKEVGIKTVNMDLIVGLPGEGIEQIEHTLRELELLQPDNLTVHTLAVKKGSKYILEKDSYQMAGVGEIEEMLRLAAEFAQKNSLVPYYLYRQKQIMGNFENIGYSRESEPCLYNISIMEERETIIGIGMGSTTKLYNKATDKIDTLANFRNLEDYMNRLTELKSRKRHKIKEIEQSW